MLCRLKYDSYMPTSVIILFVKNGFSHNKVAYIKGNFAIRYSYINRQIYVFLFKNW